MLKNVKITALKKKTLIFAKKGNMNFAKIIEANDQVLLFKDPEPLDEKFILWRMVCLDGKLQGKIIEFDTEDERETYYNSFSTQEANDYLKTFSKQVEVSDTTSPK